jgi:hypothetical protein
MKKIAITLSILFLFSGLFQDLYSQNAQTTKPELRTEIVTIKYIQTHWMTELLRKYLSRYGKIQQLPRDNKIVIEDTPEIIEKVLAMIKELDEKPVDLEFNVDLILGSTASEKQEALDQDLRSDPVMKELRNLLKYKAFKRLDSAIIKVQDNSESNQRIGGDGVMLNLRMRPRLIKEENGDSFQVDLRLSQHRGFKQDGNERTLTLIDTALNLKSGEKTVVGVSKLSAGLIMKDGERAEEKALILILSGNVLR